MLIKYAENNKTSRFLGGLKNNICGATAIEYGLIGGLIAVALVGGTLTLGQDTGTTLSTVQRGMIGEVMDGAGQFSEIAPETVIRDSGQFVKVNDLEGWEVLGGDQAGGSIELLKSGHDGVHLSPEQGEYYLDMTDQPKNAHIAKDLNLVANQTYTLTFDGVNRHPNSTLSPMQVIIGGEVVDTLNPAVSKDWTNYSYEFEGSADPSKNRIEFRSIGPNCRYCGKGFGLANINVQ